MAKRLCGSRTLWRTVFGAPKTQVLIEKLITIIETARTLARSEHSS